MIVVPFGVDHKKIHTYACPGQLSAYACLDRGDPCASLAAADDAKAVLFASADTAKGRHFAFEARALHLKVANLQDSAHAVREELCSVRRVH